ncbi:hypothetical protein, partial [Faecalibaculum rodentium]|uniref:hypothetical protein n=1 Tax=Faecalibaculum rodentium TaxID=1702221 RepID=UPI00259C7151
HEGSELPFITLVIDPKVALLKGVDPVQFCVFFFICLELIEANQTRLKEVSKPPILFLSEKTGGNIVWQQK